MKKGGREKHLAAESEQRAVERKTCGFHAKPRSSILWARFHESTIRDLCHSFIQPFKRSKYVLFIRSCAILARLIYHGYTDYFHEAILISWLNLVISFLRHPYFSRIY